MTEPSFHEAGEAALADLSLLRERLEDASRSGRQVDAAAVVDTLWEHRQTFAVVGQVVLEALRLEALAALQGWRRQLGGQLEDRSG